MKNRVPRSVACALLLGVVLAAGCAGSPDIWPSGAPPWVSLRYQGPARAMESQQAIGAIKNLQTQFCTWDGWNISQLDVDSFGLRARAQWVETSTNSQYVPTYGGFFIGNSYVPTYGGSTQTTTTNTPREEMVIIPFNKVTAIELYQYPTLPRDNKFGVSIKLEGGATQPATVFGWLIGKGESVVLRFATEPAATEFADALWSLTQAQGRTPEFSRRDVSFYLRDLSPAQKEDLADGKVTGGGAVVVSVGRGGPADRAGVQVGDVILKVEGAPVASGEEVFSRINAAGETVTIEAVRRGMVSDEKGRMVPGWVRPSFTVTRSGM